MDTRKTIHFLDLESLLDPDLILLKMDLNNLEALLTVQSKVINQNTSTDLLNIHMKKEKQFHYLFCIYTRIVKLCVLKQDFVHSLQTFSRVIETDFCNISDITNKRVLSDYSLLA